jgi:hypothetical protein
MIAQEQSTAHEFTRINEKPGNRAKMSSYLNHATVCSRLVLMA